MWIEADEEKGKIDMVEEVLSMANSYNQRIFILLLDIDSHIAHPVSRQSRLPPAASIFVYSFFFSVHVTATWAGYASSISRDVTPSSAVQLFQSWTTYNFPEERRRTKLLYSSPKWETYLQIIYPEVCCL